MFNQNNQKKSKNIKLFLTDIDGVLTNSIITYHTDGSESTAFNIKDGLIVSHLFNAGIEVGFLSGRDSPNFLKRANALSIKICEIGIQNKFECYQQIKNNMQLQDEQIAFIGDDLIDLEVLQNCGLSCCPSDAVETIKKQVDIISTKKGGEGVFREIADFILRSQNNKTNE